MVAIRTPKRPDRRTAIRIWPIHRNFQKSGRLLLPGASRTAGIPFCCPAGSNRAFVLVTYDREAVSYAAIARA